MKEFIRIYYKEIIQVVLGLLLVFLLVRTFTPAPDKSELLKYKLEQLNQNINKMKQLQSQLNDSIASYKKDIKKIDENILKIKVEKTTVNNFFEQKKEEIKGMDKKEIDSSFKQRYKY
jgi:septal ring factor EnvC (AmiA/AmiB activator)